jgi:precorrin-3B methylase
MRQRFEGLSGFPFTGPGQKEVRTMAAPTCSKCGSVLSGYERSPELNTYVYFCCHSCRRTEEAARLRMQEEVARAEVLKKAA